MPFFDDFSKEATISGNRL